MLWEELVLGYNFVVFNDRTTAWGSTKIPCFLKQNMWRTLHKFAYTLPCPQEQQAKKAAAAAHAAKPRKVNLLVSFRCYNNVLNSFWGPNFGALLLGFLLLINH